MKITNFARWSMPALAVLTAWLGGPAAALADNGVWGNPAGGSWLASSNWDNGVIADGVGSTADFSQLPLSSSPTVTLGASRTNGFLIFGDLDNAYGWTLMGGGKFTNTLAVASGTPAITVEGQLTAISNVLAGTQGLLINGPGTLLLAATNSYTGGTTISGALVLAGSQYALGPNNTVVSAVTVNSGATLDINGAASLSGGFWYGLTLAGSGTAGQGALINNGANGATGQRQTPNISLAADTTIGGSGNIMMVGSSYTANALTLNGHVLTKIGANAFDFCNTAVSGAGPILINGGTVGVYHTASTAGGTAFVLADDPSVNLALNNLALSIGSLAGGGPDGGTVALGTGNLTVGGDNTTPAPFAGTITGTGKLIKIGTGTLTLSGSSSYTGNTVISNGAVLITGSLATTTVTVAPGGMLGGTGTLAGPVTVQSGGLLAVATNLAAGATVGTLTIDNTLTLIPGATNLLRIAKNGGVPASDLISGVTVTTLGGTLVVANITSDGTPLADGDQFTLFANVGTYAGGFTNVVLPTLPNGLSWNVSSLTVNGSISVINSAATPVFNPAAGGYVGAQSVTISSLTPSAVIHYTTDGSTPTADSPVYSTPVIVPVDSTVTLQAIALAPGYSPSALASGTYQTEAVAVWTNLYGGSWAVAANWTNNIIPNGSGVTADLSQLALPGGAGVSLDNTWTVGNLILGDVADQGSWEIDPGNNNGTLVLAASGTPVITVSNQSANITAALAGTNGLVKAGAGTLVFSTLQSGGYYTGNTYITGGTLELAGNWNSSFTVGGGNYTVGSNATLQVDNYNAHYMVGPETVVNLLGGSQLAWNSTGADPYSPYLGIVNLDSSDGAPATVNTSLGNSAPRFGHYTNGIITSTGTVTNLWNGNIMLVSGGATFLNISNSGPLQISGGIYDLSGYPGLPVVKTGCGLLNLAGGNNYAGPTIVSNGVLWLTGSLGAGLTTIATNGILCGTGSLGGGAVVQAGGTLAVGLDTSASASAGTLNISGNLTFNAGGTNFMRISKTGGGIRSDTLAGMTSLNYGGTLVLDNITSDGTPLAAGDTFTLFGAGTYVGGFANYVLPALPAGLLWDVSRLTVNGSITVGNSTATPIFNPVAGVYFGNHPVTVTISSITPGATIYYTLDGTTPNSGSLSGTTPVVVVVPVNTNLTIQAYSHLGGYADSTVVSATYITEAAAVWTNSTGGSWSTAGNWINNIIPDTRGATADFSQLTLSSNVFVTLDGPQTIGNLVFGDLGNAYGWEIDPGASGPLTLDAGTNSPVIMVNNQAATISAVLTGTGGLTKAGPGRLVLTSTVTNYYYSGNTYVSAGTLELAGNWNGGISQGGGNYTVSNNAVLQVDSSAGRYPVGPQTIVDVLGGGELAWNATAGDSVSAYLGVVNLDSSDGLPATINTTLGNSEPRFGYYANGLITSVGSTTNFWNGGFMLVNGSGYTITVSNGAPLTVFGSIHDLTGYAGAPLEKIGPGLLTLDGTNVFAGSTVVGGGVLLVNGIMGAGGLTVQSGGLLGGSGAIGGITAVQAGGTIQGGDGRSAHALSVATLNLGAGATDVTYSEFAVATGGAVTATSLNVNGTNLISVSDASLTVGTNTLFTYGGGSIGGASGFGGLGLGTLPPGVTAHLLNTGAAVQLAVTSVQTVATNAPVLAAVTGANSLTLSWPADHLGWRLEVQTNSLNTGLNTNWVTWAGSTNVVSVPIPLTPASPAVFFRLVYP